MISNIVLVLGVQELDSVIHRHTGFQVCGVGGLTAEAPAVPLHQRPRGRVVLICEEGSSNSCRGVVTNKTI